MVPLASTNNVWHDGPKGTRSPHASTKNLRSSPSTKEILKNKSLRRLDRFQSPSLARLQKVEKKIQLKPNPYAGSAAIGLGAGRERRREAAAADEGADAKGHGDILDLEILKSNTDHANAEFTMNGTFDQGVKGANDRSTSGLFIQ